MSPEARQRLKAWQAKHMNRWAKALLAAPQDTTQARLIPDEGVVLIMGEKGGGKSGLAMEIMDDKHRRKGMGGAVCYPQNTKRIRKLLPRWVKVVTNVKELPSKSTCIIDEAPMVAHARRTASSDALDMEMLVAISRQKHQLIILISHHARKLDINDIQASDLIIWKSPTLADTMWERDEIQVFSLRAWECFQKLYPPNWNPTKPKPKNVLRYCYAMNLKRMAFYGLNNKLPDWWSEELSTVFSLFENGTEKLKIGKEKRKHDKR
jgi:hypothetical protein